MYYVLDLILFLGLIALIYIWGCYPLYILAKKLEKEDKAFLAWIPIGNLFLLIILAKYSLGTFVFFMIPVVNIFFGLNLWYRIASFRGKNPWIILFFFIPIANLFVPIFIALD